MPRGKIFNIIESTFPGEKPWFWRLFDVDLKRKREREEREEKRREKSQGGRKSLTFKAVSKLIPDAFYSFPISGRRHIQCYFPFKLKYLADLNENSGEWTNDDFSFPFLLFSSDFLTLKWRERQRKTNRILSILIFFAASENRTGNKFSKEVNNLRKGQKQMKHVLSSFKDKWLTIDDVS